jgi:hypothetical protein
VEEEKKGGQGTAVVVAAAVSPFVLTSPPSPHVRAHSPVLVPVFVWPSFALARLCACPRSFVPARLFARSAFAWPPFAMAAGAGAAGVARMYAPTVPSVSLLVRARSCSFVPVIVTLAPFVCLFVLVAAAAPPAPTPPAPATPTLAGPLVCSRRRTRRCSRSRCYCHGRWCWCWCRWGCAYVRAHRSFRFFARSCALVLVRACCCHPRPPVVAALMGHPMVSASKTC